MKRKYTVLGAGVLLLVFMVWLLSVTTPPQLAIMLRSSSGAPSSRYFNYAMLGGAELLLIIPLIVYMAVTKTSLAALMGNRTTVRQNLLAVALGVVLVPAMNVLDVLAVELFQSMGAHIIDISALIVPHNIPELLVGMMAIGAAAGIVEEPVFRGVALRGLGSVAAKRTAIVLSALIFSLVHGDLVGAPSRFVAGLVLGLMTWRAGALLPGIFTHAAFNTTSLAIILAMNTALPDWQGFALLPGASPAVTNILTWLILSSPFVIMSWGVYKLFDRATPVTAKWSERPYVVGQVKPAHYICWIAMGALTLGIVAMNTISMWMPKDVIDQVIATMGG